MSLINAPCHIVTSQRMAGLMSLWVMSSMRKKAQKARSFHAFWSVMTGERLFRHSIPQNRQPLGDSPFTQESL